MKYNNVLTALLLSTTLIAAPALTGTANAHDNADQNCPSMQHQHHHLSLSKDKMELLRSTMKKVHEDNKDVFEDMHKLHKDRHDILAAQTFDSDAFLAVQAKIEKDHDLIEQSRDAAFASIADKFTSEEREHIVHRMGHHHHHGGKKGHGWKRDADHKDWHHKNDQQNSDQGEQPASAGQ